jgi:hypothetical protein
VDLSMIMGRQPRWISSFKWRGRAISVAVTRMLHGSYYCPQNPGYEVHEVDFGLGVCIALAFHRITGFVISVLYAKADKESVFPKEIRQTHQSSESIELRGLSPSISSISI